MSILLITDSNMRVSESGRFGHLGGATIFSLLVFLHSALALGRPADFAIGKTLLYSYYPCKLGYYTSSSYRAAEEKYGLYLHMSDILIVDLHWTINNTKKYEVVRINIDPILRVVPLKELYLEADLGTNKAPLRIATCDTVKLATGTIECIISDATQSVKDDFHGKLRLMTTLDPGFSAYRTSRSLKFNRTFNHNGSSRTKKIAFPSPKYFDKLKLNYINLQRACTWIPPRGEDRYFLCTVTLPVGYEWSKAIVTDEILRGNATPVEALFTRKEMTVDKHLERMSEGDYSTAISYENQQFRLEMKPGVKLNSWRYNYKLDIVYKSHNLEDDIYGFVGKAHMSIQGNLDLVERLSYLPPYSA